MKHRIRRTLALVLCIVIMSVSSVALAAPSKTFTQKPTLKAITHSVKSGEYAEYSVTPSVPGFLTVKLLSPEGALIRVLEDYTEVHTKANNFDFHAKDANGNYLPIGNYTLEIDFVNQFGVEAKTLTKKVKVKEPANPDDLLQQTSSALNSVVSEPLNGAGIPVLSASIVPAPNASAAGASAPAASVSAPAAAPAVPTNEVAYQAGEFVMGDEGLMIGVGVSDSASQENAGYWSLTADATDEQIWAAITRDLTGVDVGENESAYIYDSVKDGRKKLGSVSGISQGLNVVVQRTDGWSLVEAFRNEDGAFVRGYIRTNKLRTADANANYGLVIDKAAQTLTVFKDGARVGSCQVSTGLPTAKYLHRETPAGEFITVTRRGTIEYYGNGFSKYTIRINSSYHLSEIPTTKKNGTNFEILAGSLGTKATRGNICIAHDASTDGGINAEWIWNMTNENKRVKILIFDDKPRTDVPVGSK